MFLKLEIKNKFFPPSKTKKWKIIYIYEDFLMDPSSEQTGPDGGMLSLAKHLSIFYKNSIQGSLKQGEPLLVK